ncbi:hypothetical protein HK405_012072, partial [Cladochytrium tenue]
MFTFENILDGYEYTGDVPGLITFLTTSAPTRRAGLRHLPRDGQGGLRARELLINFQVSTYEDRQKRICTILGSSVLADGAEHSPLVFKLDHTVQAISDFNGAALAHRVCQFSGGQSDMYKEVLKFGSYIVDALREYCQPVFVYVVGELHGGAWVVLDPTINPAMMEMHSEEKALARLGGLFRRTDDQAEKIKSFIYSVLAFAFQRLFGLWLLALVPFVLFGAPYFPLLYSFYFGLLHYFYFINNIRTAYATQGTYYLAKQHSYVNWRQKAIEAPKVKDSILFDDVRHVIVIPNYKEDLGTLRETLLVLASHECARQSYRVILAMEETEAGASDKATQLMQEYGSQFLEINFTVHPKNIPGEIRGKSSNSNWGATTTYHRTPENERARTIVTVMDADSCFASDYFTAMTYNFVMASRAERNLMMFAPTTLFDRNGNNVPVFARLTDIFWCVGVVSNMYDASPIKFPCSAYSLSMNFCAALGFWDVGPDAIGEDLHMYLKAYFATSGRVIVRTIYSPTSQCNVEGKQLGGIRGYFSFIHARYTQAKRHLWGSLDSGWALKRGLLKSSAEECKNELLAQTYAKELDMERDPTIMYGPDDRAKFRPGQLITLYHRLFEAHVLMGHFFIILVISTFYIPVSSVTIAMPASQFLWSAVTGNHALANSLVIPLDIMFYLRILTLIPYVPIIYYYEKYHQWCGVERWKLQAKSPMKAEAGSEQVQYLGMRSSNQYVRSIWNMLDWVVAPISVTLFYTAPLIVCHLSHLYTNALTYVVAAKAATEVAALPRTVSESTLRPGVSEEQQVNYTGTNGTTASMNASTNPSSEANISVTAIDDGDSQHSSRDHSSISHVGARPFASLVEARESSSSAFGRSESNESHNESDAISVSTFKIVVVEASDARSSVDDSIKKASSDTATILSSESSVKENEDKVDYIDGLRVLAALEIFSQSNAVFNTGPGMGFLSRGFLALHLFFAISGRVNGISIRQDLSLESIAKFAIRRSVRLYWLAVGALVFFWFLYLLDGFAALPEAQGRFDGLLPIVQPWNLSSTSDFTGNSSSLDVTVDPFSGAVVSFTNGTGFKYMVPSIWQCFKQPINMHKYLVLWAMLAVMFLTRQFSTAAVAGALLMESSDFIRRQNIWLRNLLALVLLGGVVGLGLLNDVQVDNVVNRLMVNDVGGLGIDVVEYQGDWDTPYTANSSMAYNALGGWGNTTFLLNNPQANVESPFTPVPFHFRGVLGSIALLLICELSEYVRMVLGSRPFRILAPLATGIALIHPLIMVSVRPVVFNLVTSSDRDPEDHSLTAPQGWTIYVVTMVVTFVAAWLYFITFDKHSVQIGSWAIYVLGRRGESFELDVTTVGTQGVPSMMILPGIAQGNEQTANTPHSAPGSGAEAPPAATQPELNPVLTVADRTDSTLTLTVLGAGSTIDVIEPFGQVSVSALKATAPAPPAAKPVNPKSDHLVYLDGLRGIASFFVFITHYLSAPDIALSPSMKAITPYFWDIAVPIFFILSGAVVNRQILKKKDIKTFVSTVVRRPFRLWYPTLGVSLLLFILDLAHCFDNLPTGFYYTGRLVVAPNPLEAFWQSINLYSSNVLPSYPIVTQWTLYHEMVMSYAIYFLAAMIVTYHSRRYLFIVPLLVCTFCAQSWLFPFILGYVLVDQQKVFRAGNVYLRHGMIAVIWGFIGWCWYEGEVWLNSYVNYLLFNQYAETFTKISGEYPLYWQFRVSGSLVSMLFFITIEMSEYIRAALSFGPL